ncbi:MAG: hypothetical protein IJ415_04810, partial [Clostridia bacterium]|nr:hypothetical protein [Clostridia bacterium]
MKKVSETDQIEDFTRFDEVYMNGFSGNVWSSKSPIFVAITGAGSQTWNQNTPISESNMVFTKTYLNSNKTLQIIAYVKDSDNNAYYCTNGVAVWDKTAKQIKLLSAGSYLNFYIQTTDEDGDEVYSIADFEYEAKVKGSGQTKSWNIITKEIPTEKLTLGILVVNNSGKFEYDKYFDTVGVTITEIPLDYTVEQANVNLEITFEETKTKYPDMSFLDFVTITNGSYNACVFVVEESVDIINTIPTIKFEIGGKPYVLVGDMEEVDGKKVFVNKVIVNDNVKYKNSSCKISMLQLKNAFDKKTDDVINAILATISDKTDVKTFKDTDTDKIVLELKSELISISAQYIVNPDLLTVEFYKSYSSATKEDEGIEIVDETEQTNELEEFKGNYAFVYENTDNHYIVISSKNANMWEKLKEFYALDISSFAINYPDNLKIKSVTTGNNGELIITYNAESCLSNENLPISITLENIGMDYDIGSILILNGSPKDIVFNAEYTTIENDVQTTKQVKVTLDNSAEEAKISSNYLNVKVGYESG